MRSALAAALALAAACGGYRDPPPLRPEPVPYADTLPIPEPASRGPAEAGIFLREMLLDRVVRPPVPGGGHEAANVTRFDDVVASAWFEHRNGREPMTPGEVARGPTGRGPDTSRTLTVVGGKTAGVTPGFTLRDARGDRYVVKFDAPGFRGLGTSAGVIANRLFHAAGYNVPEDYLLVFDSARLAVAPDARVRVDGGTRPMTREDVDRILARTEPLEDGRFLALASQFVPGTPKGPFRFNGTRDDDPNDYYPHQYRRELRGLFVVAAWLNHVDLRLGNTLSTYVPPGYLRHYLIDFASALGSNAGRGAYTPQAGAELRFDLWPVLARFVTLGLYHAPWELEQHEIVHPSVGWMATESFRPGSWKPGWPSRALDALTPADGYWGAKIVGSFTDEQIRAAVGAGRLPPSAADTLSDMLIFRRDRTTRHWYGEVAPVEDVEVVPGRPARLVFRDLGVEEGHWAGPATVYRWRLAHPARDLRASGESRGTAGPRQELTLGPLARRAGAAGPDPDGSEALAELRLVAERPDADGRAAVVWLRWEGPDDGYRVVGLRH